MKNRNLMYNQWHDIMEKGIIMSKRDSQLKGEESFGEFGAAYNWGAIVLG